jgi:hypothetical protein
MVRWLVQDLLATEATNVVFEGITKLGTGRDELYDREWITLYSSALMALLV